MDKTQTLTVTKLEGARRQLETAIRLYFDYGDPVSIHSLTGAAYAVLRDLNEKRGGDMMLKDSWRLLDTPEAQEFRRIINQPENFLKHADKDPDGSYTLSLRRTEVMMFEASLKYRDLSGETRPLLMLFLGWFLAQYRATFESFPPEISAVLGAVDFTPVPTDRRRYIQEFLPIAQDIMAAAR